MPAPLGPYSPAVRAGDFLYTSGQLGLEGDSLVDGLREQTLKCLANLQALLQENGAELDKVVKTTVFLTDMAQFPVLNEAYAEVFGNSRPARSTVEVSALPKGALVEVEAVAYLG